MYSLLTIVLNIEPPEYSKKTNIKNLEKQKLRTKVFPINCLFLSQIFSHNYKKTEIGLGKFNLSSRFSDFLNVGVFECFFLEELGFIIISAIIYRILLNFIILDPSIKINTYTFTDIILLISYASIIRFMYIIFWFGFWNIIKRFKNEKYFIFHEKIDDIISP